MLNIRKKHGKITKAYRLGELHTVLDRLIGEGKITDQKDGFFEVFSQEAVKSESGHGQLAYTGDWIRLDSAGYPYPCKNEWFQENMRHIDGDDYEQIPKDLTGWTADMEMCLEVEFLIREKGLTLDNDSFEKFFRAVLWGNPEAADRNAVLVFYSIKYAEDGTVADAEYNFVDRKEFDNDYNIL